MTPFTGTRADFERLAPRGLVLTARMFTTPFYLYHADGEYRYSPTSTLRADAEPMDGAWRAFRDSCQLFIYRQPTTRLYRRHS